MINYPYLVTSDLHFHNWTFGSYITTKGVNSRLQSIIDEFVRACSTLKEQGGKDVIIAGDMFHTRGIITPSVYNPVYKMFEGLSNQGFIFHTIPGNHDLEYEACEERGNTFASFKAIKNFNIYYKPVIQLLSSYEKMVFIPWGSGHQAITGDFKNVENLTIVAHIGLTNVVTGVKGTVDASAVYDNNKGLKNAFFGHFHNHKHFKFHDDGRSSNIYSIGATTHQSFKDVGSLAGFLIVSNLGVEHHKTQAPLFVDYSDYDWRNATNPALMGKFHGNFVRMKDIDELLSSEDLSLIKTNLETIGALKVVNQIVAKSIGPIEGCSKHEFVFSTHMTTKQSVKDYIDKKYSFNLKEKLGLLLDEEEFYD